VEDKWVCSQKGVKDDGLEKEEEEKVYLSVASCCFLLGR